MPQDLTNAENGTSGDGLSPHSTPSPTASESTSKSSAQHIPEDRDEPLEGNVNLPAEAISHFEQFPAGQFISEHAIDLQSQGGLALQSQSPPDSPRQLPDHSDTSGHDAPQPQPQPQPHVAQWSTQALNPLIPHFIDPELVRNSSGSSVLEEDAVLGESGRTYHGYKDGLSSYLLPNDGAEQDRLDFQHAMMAHLWEGRLVLAPLPRAPKLVHDVATGTGIWALEFARANPTSFVIGTDLSKIQPSPDVPNCLFERMDCEEDWLWTYKFDYVHIRMIVTAIRDPERLLQQAYDSLRPGGWIELQDADWDLLSEDGPQEDHRVSTSYLKQWFELSEVGATANGIDLHKARQYKSWLSKAGFVDVVEEKFKVPCTPWPEDSKAQFVGEWMRVNYLSGLRGVAYKMLRSAGMAPEVIEDFISATRDEVKHGNIRGYTPWYAVYGRKPFDEETNPPTSDS
ncbi:hypothetical protein SUNI508_12493 [Seiridium unicorne]|uniref:Methyltransferase n=1 Tax=Seiridium unicorne TaxID=138068 RepID=A0ABR2VH47_9PEZI